jgi:hypothetical protein
MSTGEFRTMSTNRELFALVLALLSAWQLEV